MNKLASRKKLLIAESELNRAQLARDYQTMVDEVHALADQAKTVRSFASAAATLVAGIASCRGQKSARNGEKPSWFQTILKSAGMVSTFWDTFRSRSREKDAN
ncbi:MAG: hypothetical protein ACLQSR_08050 [Limisphaerales bacterium]